MHKINYSKLIIALIIPQVAGFLGTLATTPNIYSWYKYLNKPSFNPPNWIFGPVWTILFLLMGVGLYLVWTSKKSEEIKIKAYAYFYAQLIFNMLWSFLFFGLRNPLSALMEIFLLWLLIALNIIYFYKINKKAAYLMLPYILWVSFAAILNYYIVILN